MNGLLASMSFPGRLRHRFCFVDFVGFHSFVCALMSLIMFYAHFSGALYAKVVDVFCALRCLSTSQEPACSVLDCWCSVQDPVTMVTQCRF